MPRYASSTELYRELRAALTPWCKTGGWRREAGSKAGWYKLLDEEKRVVFVLSCIRWGNGDTGNTLNGDLRLEPVSAAGEPWARASDFTRCLVRSELDELARLQTAVNLRRPPAPRFLWEHATKDPPFERHLRTLYEPVAEPYTEGKYAALNYYSLDDVREFASFISRHLPTVLVRFLENRCPPPLYDPTPPYEPPAGAAA